VGQRTGGAPLNDVAHELTALLAGAPDVAARGLVGCLLTDGEVTVRLTETEAYAGLGEDPGSHAHRGRTSRNDVMFGPAGFAYVYFTYGMHWCLNIVTGPVGAAAAVLVRAGEVVAGAPLARSRRTASRHDVDLARGPARLARALGVDRSVNGTCLLDGSGPLTLQPPTGPVDLTLVRSGPRVGVTGGHDTPWRFWVDGDRTVSTYRRHVPRRRGGAEGMPDTH